jgi:hypothetical protein
MKTLARLIVLAVLSLSIGIAAASPLLVSELEVRPFPRAPEGPEPEFAMNVVYAKFSVDPADPSVTVPSWYPKNETLMDISYYVVLNVTNNSDEEATLDFVEFAAAKEYTRGSAGFLANGTSGTQGPYRGAWLDGEWINLTWIPSAGIPLPPRLQIPRSNITLPTLPPEALNQQNDYNSTDGYWREGVEIYQVYSGTKLSNIWILINGTWVDVTGRIEIPDLENIFNNMVSSSKTIVGEWHMFQGPLPENFTSTTYRNSTTTKSTTFENGTTVTVNSSNDIDSFPGPIAHTTIFTGPGLFNEVWAPHESRLLIFIGTRLTSNPEALEELNTGEISIHILSQTRLVNYLFDGVFMDTTAVVDEIQKIQLQPDGEFFVYNAVLGEGETFQPDQWGVEVFIKPRS